MTKLTFKVIHYERIDVPIDPNYRKALFTNNQIVNLLFNAMIINQNLMFTNKGK